MHVSFSYPTKTKQNQPRQSVSIGCKINWLQIPSLLNYFFIFIIWINISLIDTISSDVENEQNSAEKQSIGKEKYKNEIPANEKSKMKQR